MNHIADVYETIRVKLEKNQPKQAEPIIKTVQHRPTTVLHGTHFNDCHDCDKEINPGKKITYGQSITMNDFERWLSGQLRNRTISAEKYHNELIKFDGCRYYTIYICNKCFLTPEFTEFLSDKKNVKIEEYINQ